MSAYDTDNSRSISQHGLGGPASGKKPLQINHVTVWQLGSHDFAVANPISRGSITSLFKPFNKLQIECQIPDRGRLEPPVILRIFRLSTQSYATTLFILISTRTWNWYDLLLAGSDPFTPQSSPHFQSLLKLLEVFSRDFAADWIWRISRSEAFFSFDFTFILQAQLWLVVLLLDAFQLQLS